MLIAIRLCLIGIVTFPLVVMGFHEELGGKPGEGGGWKMWMFFGINLLFALLYWDGLPRERSEVAYESDKR